MSTPATPAVPDAPEPRTAIADAQPRARVAVAGVVTVAEVAPWAGGPVLEVTIDDGTGTLLLAFTGRREIAGVAPGEPMAASGVVLVHRGRRALMNPAYRLTPDE